MKGNSCLNIWSALCPLAQS